MSFKPVSAHQINPEQAPAPVSPAPAPTMMTTAPARDTFALVVEKNREQWQQAGLNPAQIEAEMRQVVAQFNPKDPNAVIDFGKKAGEQIANYSNGMLEQVRSGQVEGLGDKLSQIVVLAKGINLSDLEKSKSKIPILGGLIDKLTLKKEALLGRFDSLAQQIDKIVVELDQHQLKLSHRINELEKVFELNVQEYHSLGIYIAAGEVKHLELQDEISRAEMAGINDPVAAQAHQDLVQVGQRLEKRIHDLRTMQTIAVQTAPMIRMVQANNQSLLEKFQNIKALTIPAWKKQYTLAVALLEQKKSVELATKIDDQTNDLLKRNAELLHQNSVSTARANQRGVVDLATLESVQQTLITTFEEVNRIQEEGKKHRAEAAVKMQTLQSDLVKALSKPQ